MSFIKIQKSMGQFYIDLSSATDMTDEILQGSKQACLASCMLTYQASFGSGIIHVLFYVSSA